MSIKIIVNGSDHELDIDPETPLLWALRDSLGATGAKYGCGMGQCGACTVHVNGEAVRSCITPLSSVAEKEITTIEGLSLDGNHPLQQAWIAEQVSQCGYCQPGQIMTAAALLARTPHPSQAEITAAISGVLCRCGTYQRILKAISRVAAEGGAT